MADNLQGESILNKYCNILNALDSEGTYADTFFNQIVAYAISKNLQNPYFPLDKVAAEKQKEWLNDAMKQLVLQVLNDDPSLPGTVKDELKKDLNDLATAENLDMNKDAETRATETVAKAAELTSNIVMYMDYIGQGFKALARCNGFKAATAVVNKAINKFPGTGGGFPFLKGTMVLVVVSLLQSRCSPLLVKRRTGCWIHLHGRQYLHQLGQTLRASTRNRNHFHCSHGGRHCIQIL